MCPLVNVKLILKHKRNLQGKLKKDFAFEIEIHLKTSVWKKSEIYLTLYSSFGSKSPGGVLQEKLFLEALQGL